MGTQPCNPALLLPTTLYGLLSDHAYRLPRTLELESIAQDVLTLAVIPVLLWSARRSRAGSLPGHLLWLGTLARRLGHPVTCWLKKTLRER